MNEKGDGNGSGVVAEPENSGAEPEKPAEAAGEVVNIRPRARRAAPEHVQISVFGAIPERCKSWGMRRATLGGQWEDLSHGVGGTLLHEWPLSELNEANVRLWWGPGTYRAMWFEPTPNGGKRFMAQGRRVTLEPLPDDAPSPAAAAPRPVAAAPADALSAIPGLRSTLELMQVIEGLRESSMSSAMRMAEAFGGSRNQGISAAELQLILNSQSEATAKAIAAAVAPINARLEALAADDDDDDDDATIGDAASAAAPFFKGKGWLSKVLAFAERNPKVAEVAISKGVPIAAGALQQLGAVAAEALAPPARPRARVVDAPAIESGASTSTNGAGDVVVSGPSVGGMNDAMRGPAS